jgi:hypothetical protein
MTWVVQVRSSLKLGHSRPNVYVAPMASAARVRLALTVAALVCPALGGCKRSQDDLSLAAAKNKQMDLSAIPVPPADGPRLAAIAASTPVNEKPSVDAPVIGTLRWGSSVARAREPVSTDGCAGGWFPIRPRGFVCVGETATLNLSHPTLAAMRERPNLQASLPYTYVRTAVATRVFEWDRSRRSSVREVGKLKRGSGFAVTGAWDAALPEGGVKHLDLLPDGRFVIADDARQPELPEFHGVELNDQNRLPVAFVVKHGVRTWRLGKTQATKAGELQPQASIRLTGKFRALNHEIYWATEDGGHVRHRDVTLVPKRDGWPEFSAGDQKWIDLSVTTGAMVLYEGRRAVYVTLVSTGQDRFGDPKTTASTQLGVHNIVSKYITANKSGAKPFADGFEVQDAPWVLELSSGQMIHGAYWHNRFGIEYGPGNVQASPNDAAQLFRWSGPELPEGWHSVNAAEPDKKTIVLIRK